MHKTDHLLQLSKQLLQNFKTYLNLATASKQFVSKIDAFMQLGPRRKVPASRDQATPSYRTEFRFKEVNVTWMTEDFLNENLEITSKQTPKGSVRP